MSTKIGDDDNVTAFVERWKEVISDGEEEKMNAIYDEMVEIVQLFSVAFMVENRLDDLLKQSKPIGNKEKYKEIKTLVQEQYNEKKKQEKEQNKKRKQTESSTDGKPKKSRVKPERVMEVAAKLTEVLVSNFKLGIKEMPLVNLALKAGFKNHRSDAPADAMKLLKKQGFVKVNAKKVSLTDKGSKNISRKKMWCSLRILPLSLKCTGPSWRKTFATRRKDPAKNL